MRTFICVLGVFNLLLFFCGCKPKDSYVKSYKLTNDTVDIMHEEYNYLGNLIGLYHEKDGLPHGKEEQYYPNGEKKLEGLWYKGKKVGWFKYFYESGKLEAIRQYIRVNDPENWGEESSYLNQVIRFNEQGDTVKQGGFFMRLITSGDTIKNGMPYGFRITLVAPLFKEMNIVLCDMDEEYALLPNAICDTFGTENYQRSLMPKEYKLGENTIRGKILNFENYIDSVGESRQHIATIYFTNRYYVKP